MNFLEFLFLQSELILDRAKIFVELELLNTCVLNKAIMLVIVECQKYAVVLFDHLLVHVELIQGLLFFAEFFELRVHILRDDLFDLLKLSVLLSDEFEGLCLLRLVEADARSLLNES